MGHDELRQMAVEFAEAVRPGDEDTGALAEAFAVAVGEALEPMNRLVSAALAGALFRFDAPRAR